MTVADQALSSPEAVPLSMRGPASTSVVVGYGFWLFLLSDIVIFAALFAAYAVLGGETNGGPPGAELFDKTHVFIETACLLASSVTCGFGSMAVQQRNKLGTYLWMTATFVLGASFLSLEGSEFAGMVAAGNTPSRSAFLSAFFALVGTHGLHVAAGLFWLVIMMLQVTTLGFQPMVRRRFFCFSLFWHALDIVWIGVFTIVYLGAR
ncbi:cytochrome o ubiquinol oxidase subunit III [Bradyrhizobium canariense]|uniref:Cytochrome bo(3) ubiquinol oxidase subunit 3 n=1 Tax=Bradyrhizobium canariense TaxID=255045 RepID=A0A1H2AH90_9BRAD|nr:cytochrome o ubiquinol oxidase subunit III [Bradyrhizobium canariense]SDT45353.1 cytochrome o ubiquinol oxidase subunit 3 [Bradyrhizobium canariense]